MINVEVVIDSKQWKKKFHKPQFLFNKLVKFFPKKYQFLKKKAYLTVLLADNKKIRSLNKKFRNKNKSTDILSFHIENEINLEKNLYIGDIIISYEYMNTPTDISNLEFNKKVIKIFIHGFLHLLGHDHKRLSEFKKMSKEEEKIFSLLRKKIEKII